MESSVDITLLTVRSQKVQVIGYVGRIWSHYDPESIGGFVIQAILILIAPALYAASIYMILARLIRAVNAEHLSLIPIKWVTKIFVTGDVVAFSLQAGGGGIQSAGTLEMYDIGEKLIIEQLYDHQGNLAAATVPVLLLDMWEHAFYLDYVNVKADYVKAFWNIVNWADVSARFEKAREKTSGLLLLS